MAQNQDPLVFNIATGEWQNASNPGPSGTPIGLTIGAFDGSAVSLQPSVGQTMTVDGGSQWTVLSAVQLASNALSETTPAYSATMVLNQGAANEQLAHLTVASIGGATAQAVLMASESADLTVHGSIKHGTVTQVGGSGTDYAFTSMHSMFPHSKQLQLGSGFSLVSTQPGGSAGEFWHNLSLGAGWTGTFQYTFVPLGSGGSVLIDFQIGGGTVTDATSIGTMPATYRPLAVKRVIGTTDGGPKSTGGSMPSIRIQASGDVSVFGVSTSSTFLIGTGIYPLGT